MEGRRATGWVGGAGHVRLAVGTGDSAVPSSGTRQTPGVDAPIGDVWQPRCQSSRARPVQWLPAHPLPIGHGRRAHRPPRTRWAARWHQPCGGRSHQPSGGGLRVGSGGGGVPDPGSTAPPALHGDALGRDGHCASSRGVASKEVADLGPPLGTGRIPRRLEPSAPTGSFTSSRNGTSRATAKAQSVSSAGSAPASTAAISRGATRAIPASSSTETFRAVRIERRPRPGKVSSRRRGVADRLVEPPAGPEVRDRTVTGCIWTHRAGAPASCAQ